MDPRESWDSSGNLWKSGVRGPREIWPQEALGPDLGNNDFQNKVPYKVSFGSREGSQGIVGSQGTRDPRESGDSEGNLWKSGVRGPMGSRDPGNLAPGSPGT